MPLRALFLAAGKSTRIHSITQGQPKPTLRLSGDRIVERNLRWLGRQGVREIFMNLHYRPDAVRRVVGDGSRFGVRVQYSYEPTILGTAGAAKNLAHVFDRTFFVIYGDNVLSTDLSAMLCAHRRHQGVATIALFDRNVHPHTGIAGGRVQLDADRRVTAFLEGAGDEVSPLVNAGVYVLEPEVIDHIPADTFYDFGKDVFPGLLGDRQALYGHEVSEYCLGIDTPFTYRRALDLINSGRVRLQ